MRFRKYPLFHFRATVVRPIADDDDPMRIKHRLVRGRPGWCRWEYYGEKMVRHYDEGRRLIGRFWMAQIDRYSKAELESHATVFLRYDTWAAGWFEHLTIDHGQCDDEVLASFSEYVDRRERWNREALNMERDPYACPPYPLMGAGERWRWHGFETSPQGGLLGHSGNETDPPCRCDGCQAAGVIRICH